MTPCWFNKNTFGNDIIKQSLNDYSGWNVNYNNFGNFINKYVNIVDTIYVSQWELNSYQLRICCKRLINNFE